MFACAWKWKKLISTLIDWLYYLFFLLHYLSLIYRTFYTDFLSFQFNHKMVILWNSINIRINCLQFWVNWFKMHPSQWKKLDFLNFVLSILEFDMNFIFENQKILISCFDKFDYLFWPHNSILTRTYLFFVNYIAASS